MRDEGATFVSYFLDAPVTFSRLCSQSKPIKRMLFFSILDYRTGPVSTKGRHYDKTAATFRFESAKFGMDRIPASAGIAKVSLCTFHGTCGRSERWSGEEEASMQPRSG